MADVAKNPLFAAASDMPEPVTRTDAKRVAGGKKQAIAPLVTPDIRTHIHHMAMVSGHSDCGSHTLIPEFEQQVRRKLNLYNREFHRQKGADESCPIDGSLREFQRVFNDHNLFRAWEQFAQGGKVLDPYQWHMISLIYRRRGVDEIRQLSAAAERAGNTSGDHDDFKYAFVATYASLASLITSVKAWQGREITGWVQVGLDHVYNVLKAVPNVRPLAPSDVTMHVPGF